MKTLVVSGLDKLWKNRLLLGLFDEFVKKPIGDDLDKIKNNSRSLSDLRLTARFLPFFPAAALPKYSRSPATLRFCRLASGKNHQKSPRSLKIRQTPSVNVSVADDEDCGVLIQQIQALSLECDLTKTHNKKYYLTISDPRIREIEEVRRDIVRLNSKIDLLESRITDTPWVDKTQLDVYASEKTATEDNSTKTESVKKKSITPAATNRIVMKELGNTLENFIGKIGLNVVGIILLILGVTFLVAYVAKDFLFSPLGRVCIGSAASIALLVVGKMFKKKEKFALFSQTLIGGGWAGLYIVAYCIHHVEVVRYITNPLIGFMLLVLIACLMIVDSLRPNVKFLTIQGFALAYLTSVVHTSTLYSMSSAFLITITVLVVSFLKSRKEIPFLAYLGLLAAFLKFLLEPPADVTFVTNLSLLSCFWALFYISLPLMCRFKKLFAFCADSISILNVIGTTTLCHLVYESGNKDKIWIVLAVLAGFYFLRKLFFVFSSKEKINIGFDLILSAMLVGYAAFMKLTGLAEVYFYAFEIIVLMLFGNFFKDKRYSVVAFLIALYSLLAYWASWLFSYWGGNDFVNVFYFSNYFYAGIASFAAIMLGAFHARLSYHVEKEKLYSFWNFFDLLGLAFIITALFNHFEGVKLLLVLSGFAVVLHEAAYKYRSSAVPFVASGLSLFAASWFFFERFNIAYSTAQVNDLLYVSSSGWKIAAVLLMFLYITLRNSYTGFMVLPKVTRKSFNIAYIVVCLVMFIVWLLPEVQDKFYALVWGVQGAIVLCLGFIAKNRLIRCAGLICFSMVLVKLFFYDIVELPITLKISSFIGLGIVLIIASYGYNKLCSSLMVNKKLKQEAELQET